MAKDPKKTLSDINKNRYDPTIEDKIEILEYLQGLFMDEESNKGNIKNTIKVLRDYLDSKGEPFFSKDHKINEKFISKELSQLKNAVYGETKIERISDNQGDNERLDHLIASVLYIGAAVTLGMLLGGYFGVALSGAETVFVIGGIGAGGFGGLYYGAKALFPDNPSKGIIRSDRVTQVNSANFRPGTEEPIVTKVAGQNKGQILSNVDDKPKEPSDPTSGSGMSHRN